MTNKEIVLKLYDEVFNAHSTEKVPQYFKENYIQHNPTVEQGRAGVLKFMGSFFKLRAQHNILLALEDGDLVAVYVDVRFADGSCAVVTDIYRLEDGMMAEHWDSVQRMQDR